MIPALITAINIVFPIMCAGCHKTTTPGNLKNVGNENRVCRKCYRILISFLLVSDLDPAQGDGGIMRKDAMMAEIKRLGLFRLSDEEFGELESEMRRKYL